MVLELIVNPFCLGYCEVSQEFLKDEFQPNLVIFCFFHDSVTFSDSGTSLVVQWLRIRLPMQGTQVRSLVQEDPTCRGATKPMRHNY